MNKVWTALQETDPEAATAMRAELGRQRNTLELIASENFCSEAVLAAGASVFTNKYAEGYPGRRYYGGCEHADTVENLARERAKELFGAEHANVQPHSGTQANLADGITNMGIYANSTINLGGNINVVSKDKILAAHRDPTLYPDLVVRVTGYSAYFRSLSPEYREQIVERLLAE